MCSCGAKAAMQQPTWTAKVVNFWPTLLMRKELPGHQDNNAKLCASIAAMNEQQSQLTTSYQGVDLFSSKSPGLQWLKKGVDASVEAYFSALGMTFPIEWTLQAWGNFNRYGDYHAPHNHGWSYLSGTYYVKMPARVENSQAGAISFYDPRVSSNMLAVPGDKLGRHEYTLNPEPGTLLLWHAALHHLVHPNLSHRAAN